MNSPDGFRRLPKQVIEGDLFKEQSYTSQIIRFAGFFVSGLVALSIGCVLLLRWVNPPTSSFMQQRQVEIWNNDEDLQIQQQWISWNDISPHLKMAAIASEDQRFATHWGLDLISINEAIDDYEDGEDLRGASTITQQVAKNLFLWQQQSYIRKGIEAYFALLIEMLWSKERILEVYLNTAEFGNGVYGVEAAANVYFDTSAGQISKYNSALMSTALPAPRRYNLANPSEYMFDRSQWVIRFMDLLGNSHYLDRLN